MKKTYIVPKQYLLILTDKQQLLSGSKTMNITSTTEVDSGLAPAMTSAPVDEDVAE